jgi:serine/threonine protein kinase
LVVLIFVLAFLAVAMEVYNVQVWAKAVKRSVSKTLEFPEFDPKLRDHIIAVDSIKLGGMLGQGVQGAVYSAKWDGVDVAVKVVEINLDEIYHYQAGLSMEQELREAELEAKTLMPLRHPYIVEIFGVALKHDSLELAVWTVLEKCTCSLQDFILKKTPVPFRVRIALCRKIAQGMRYMHQKGFYHRDLKPGNILLVIPAGSGLKAACARNTCESKSAGSGLKSTSTRTSEEGGAEITPKVCDFGMAKESKRREAQAGAAMAKRGGSLGARPRPMRNAQAELAPAPTHSWTDSKGDTMKSKRGSYSEKTTNIGTPVYMAPELMSEDVSLQYDASLADVYAFAIVMWMVLARERPFHEMLHKQRIGLWGLCELISSGTRPDLYETERSYSTDGAGPAGTPGVAELNGAPREAILLMMRCWHHEPEQRPSFDEIQEHLLAVEDQLEAERSGGLSGTPREGAHREKGPPPQAFEGELNPMEVGLNRREVGIAPSVVMGTNPMGHFHPEHQGPRDNGKGIRDPKELKKLASKSGWTKGATQVRSAEQNSEDDFGIDNEDEQMVTAHNPMHDEKVNNSMHDEKVSNSMHAEKDETKPAPPLPTHSPRLSQVDGAFAFFEHHDAGAAHDYNQPSANTSWHSSNTGNKVEVYESHSILRGTVANAGHRALEKVHSAVQGTAGDGPSVVL